MFVVRYSTKPIEYALIFVCPTSSPKITRMFGFLAGACACTGRLTPAGTTARVTSPTRTVPLI